jgi:signal transduction histidine kinase
VALLATAAVSSFLESRRLQREIHALVRNAERSTYLMGSLGHALARMQSNALEALTESPDSIQPALDRIAAHQHDVRARTAELLALLAPEELERWREPGAAIERALAELELAADELATGSVEEAETRLDALGDELRGVFELLRRSMDLNQDHTLATLNAADRMLTRARWVQLAIVGLLTVGIAAIALQTLRELQLRERELDRYVARVEEANIDLESFAGRAAHDLRSVLAPLPLTARLLEEEADDPRRVAESARGIERVAQHAADLISGLLAFALAGRPTPGVVAPVAEEVDAVLHDLEPLVCRVAARVHTDVEPDLRTACDRPLLRIVLSNLISNAVKFAEGRPDPEVHVRCRRAGATVSIEVADTGPGIAADALERVFEPFYRAPGTRATGHGIGLATVRRIVEAHGGTVEVRSTVGEGSVFRAVLPLAGS